MSYNDTKKYRDIQTMKDLKDKIYEANESKDKTFKQLRKGDKIYYLEMFNSDKNHKIEVCTVISNYFYEPMSLSGGYKVPENYTLKFTRENKKKDGSAVIWKRDWDNKLYVSLSGFEGDKDRHPYHYISTDRELLVEFQENLVDQDIQEVQKEIEKLQSEYEGKKQKLDDKINALVQKKIDKYED